VEVVAEVVDSFIYWCGRTSCYRSVQCSLCRSADFVSGIPILIVWVYSLGCQGDSNYIMKPFVFNHIEIFLHPYLGNLPKTSSSPHINVNSANHQNPSFPTSVIPETDISPSYRPELTHISTLFSFYSKVVEFPPPFVINSLISFVIWLIPVRYNLFDFCTVTKLLLLLLLL